MNVWLADSVVVARRESTALDEHVFDKIITRPDTDDDLVTI